jgi:hypothetical protein
MHALGSTGYVSDMIDEMEKGYVSDMIDEMEKRLVRPKC